jgi:hypothetical protein
VSVPEWFLFLYFKYWYFRSLKRFWDCDFNFVNVLELHHSMENDKWYNKKSFDLAFHFSFNQNKLWTNWNIKRLFYTTNLVFYTSGNRFVRRTGTFGNLTFSLVPSDNRNTRSPCPTSVFTGIGQTLMSRPALLHFNLCRASEGMTARKHVQFHFNYSNCEHHWRNFIFPLQVSLCCRFVCLMVFNATFNNISVIS